MASEAAEAKKDESVLAVLVGLLDGLEGLDDARREEILATVRAVIARNEQLERQLAGLGRRSMKANEGVDHRQLRLLLEALDVREKIDEDEAETDEEEQAEAELLRRRAEAAAERARQKVLAAKANPRRKPMKKRLPAQLERRDNLIEVPECERACPKCGEQREVIGHDVSEVVEFVPAKLYVRRDRREKRACRSCEAAMVRAPLGDKIVAGGQLGCSLVAELACNKYDLGLPLHRQRKIFQRMGLTLSSSTLADQIKWAAELLRPLWLEAIDQVLASRVMHIDGSGLVTLDRDDPKGKRTGTLWNIVGADSTKPKVAAYCYASTKQAKSDEDKHDEYGPVDILEQREGIVVSDADTLFTKQRRRKNVIDAGCNMHARRYFVKALDAGDERAALIIGNFKYLYQVEEDVRDASDEERLAARLELSTPCYRDMIAWCKTKQRDEPPKSPFGRALGYLLRHETSLRRFESDGGIPIDNMAAEHSFVPVALTRKNYLFVGSDAGGQRAAIIYTVLRCCRLAGVEPFEYLSDVLPVLARKIRRVDVAQLMPRAWAEQRAEAGT